MLSWDYLRIVFGADSALDRRLGIRRLRGLLTLIGMRLRRVPPGTVVTARISAVKAGLNIPLNDLEAHFLAGGNVGRVVAALISADRANIELPWQRATAIDLAGRDVLEAVQVRSTPK